MTRYVVREETTRNLPESNQTVAYHVWDVVERKIVWYAERICKRSDSDKAYLLEAEAQGEADFLNAFV